MTSPRPKIKYREPFSNIFAGLLSVGPSPRHWVITCPSECGIGDWGWTAHANTPPAAYRRAVAHLEADHPEEDQ